jgi:peptidoglycan/xylan/chitin deacetylase (PgdA/CDA1 family)
LHKAWTQIRHLTAVTVKNMLHRSGASLRHIKDLQVSFIVTFHAIHLRDRERFAECVRFLARNFHVVGMDEMVERIRQGAPAKRDPIVAVTFDDGLRNFADIGYPILREFQVPATFYICPDLVDRAGSIWTWEVGARLHDMSSFDCQRYFDMANVSGNVQSIVNWMKTIPVSRREEIEREIHQRTPGFQFSPQQRESYELMSWQQIEDLDPRLITIGSHTATHVDLTQADPQRLELELSRSKQLLEARLSRKVQHLAYPNGNFDLKMLPVVERYYSSAVTSRPGIVKPGDNPFTLSRVHIEYDLSAFTWSLAASARREQPR